jgi:Spy/CpxP family protein refolding chaperone
MNVRRIVITVVAAAALAAPGTLIAQGGFGGPHGPGAGTHGGFGGPGLERFEEMLPQLAEVLELTDDQQAQIQSILDAEMPAIESLRDRLDDGREAFRASHQPGEFNEAEFRAHAESQAQLHVELMVASARTMSRIHGVLSAEQLDRMQDLRSLRRGPRGPRGGAGPGSNLQ